MPLLPLTPAVLTDTVWRSQDLEQCIGCGEAQAGVRLARQCGQLGDNPCRECNCRPMWCLDCFAKW